MGRTTQIKADVVIITIDGGPGEGKSTIAKLVAHRYGMIHVSSGELYRLLALVHIEDGFPSVDLSSVTVDSLLELLASNRLMLRRPEVGLEAAKIAQEPSVRRMVNDTLIALAESNDIVLDGRDMFEVFPGARFRFYFRSATGPPDAMMSSSRESKAQRALRRSLERVPVLAGRGCIGIDAFAQSEDKTAELLFDLIDRTMIRAYSDWHIDVVTSMIRSTATAPMESTRQFTDPAVGVVQVDIAESLGGPHAVGIVAETMRPTSLHKRQRGRSRPTPRICGAYIRWTWALLRLCFG